MGNEQAYKNIFVAGIDGKQFDIAVSDGRFASITESETFRLNNPDGGLWISPGIIDLHLHLAWTDFDYADQLKREASEIETLQAQAFNATLRAGVTTVRDAGGLLPDAVKQISRKYHLPLSVIACGAMLGAEDAKDTRHLQSRITEISHAGARWIKVFATGGLGSQRERVLEPVFSKEEFFTIVRSAHACDMKVMVHTWGGATLDWVAEAGADSVEHGVYMTEDQAFRLAQAQIPMIPTTAIYRIAADPAGVLALPAELRERAAFAAEAHPKAVRYAKRAGVKIGFGTDFATPALYGCNLEEFDSLMDCGLTRAEAWRSATAISAEIVDDGSMLGCIKEGYLADAVLYNADPYKAPNAKVLRESIVSVRKGTAEQEI